MSLRSGGCWALKAFNLVTKWLLVMSWLCLRCAVPFALSAMINVPLNVIPRRLATNALRPTHTTRYWAGAKNICTRMSVKAARKILAPCPHINNQEQPQDKHSFMAFLLKHVKHKLSNSQLATNGSIGKGWIIAHKLSLAGHVNNRNWISQYPLRANYMQLIF